ncbi:MAG TPA: tetratricopeptide repeat protein, partial [Gemmatimonadales bacterium]
GLPFAQNPPPPAARRARYDAYVALWAFGDGAKAVSLMEQALRGQPAAGGSNLELAEFYARAGRVARAKALLEAYRSRADSAERADPPLAWYEATAAIALAEGRFDDAIAERIQANEKDEECCSRSQFVMAEAHDRAGRPDSAIAYLEQFLATPEVFRLSWDIYMRPQAFRRLGELYEARGDREKAVRYYGNYAELWNDADPELQPLVTDVKQRIARLVRERE